MVIPKLTFDCEVSPYIGWLACINILNIKFPEE
jgi:hypothetical protein